MNRRDFIAAGVCAIAVEAHGGEPAKTRYRIGAYYFPNYHVDQRNEQVHGKGWTEWEILKRGEPKFAGHHQPKVPSWGREDEADPMVFQRKIAAAAASGISHFIFDWYWYDGAPFLNRALDEGYLGAANKGSVQFCLMWANHDWYNLMPARLHEQQRPPLYRGTYSAEEFDRITDYIVSRYFRQPAYFKVDDAPYFSIYELKNLVERMGGLTIAKEAFSRFREKAHRAGFRDIHLNAVAWGINEVADLPEWLQSLGVRSVTSYTWAHQCPFPDFPACEYSDMLSAAEAYWRKAPELFGLPYHTDVSMGWDPSPRTCQSDRFEKADYPFTSILRENTPQRFKEALLRAKAYVDSRPNIPKILTFNAWNEWTEGSHLEPEAQYGMDYLDAIRTVFGEG